MFFAALATLMEFWEVQLPKTPRIRVVHAVYIASLFAFSPLLVVGLVFIGALMRFLFSLEMDFPMILLVFRQAIIFGVSALFFQKAGLQGILLAFQQKNLSVQAKQAGVQFAIFLAWVALYTLANFVFAYLETMIIRKTTRVYPSWPTLTRSLLFNLLLVAPLGLLMYVLYEFQPNPFPWPLGLLIPSLLVIYRSIRNYTESLDAAKVTIEALAEAVDRRLEFTHDHSPLVSNLAREIAIAFGLSNEDVELVVRAARIHNLGKVGIADRILNKKEALTEDEFKIVKKHPEIGAKVASQLSIYEKEVEIIRSHHEHYDGTGYPRSLKGNQIPLGARIVAVADAFVAMTSERPYRPAMTPAQAMEEIKKCAGSKFDPKVVDAFILVMKKKEPVQLS